jgi:purine-binding chemotaxis protein CheW
MGLPPRSESSREIHVVVRHRGESFSLQVDEVGDVITVPGSLLEDAPRTLDSRWRHFIAGIHRLDQRLLIVLDIHSLLEMA